MCITGYCQHVSFKWERLEEEDMSKLIRTHRCSVSSRSGDIITSIAPFRLTIAVVFEILSSVAIKESTKTTVYATRWVGYNRHRGRREIIEKIGDKETRRLQKTRKTTAKMGGLCEERSEKGRGRRKQLRWEDCVKRDMRKAEEEDHS